MEFILATLMFPLSLSVSVPNLADLDRFLETDFFQTAFLKNDRVTIQDDSCVSGGGICDSFSSNYEIKEVVNGAADIVGTKQDGSWVSEDTVAEKDWEADAHNYARSRIAGMQSAGYQVTLISLDPASATVEVNGKTESVETRVLKVSGKSSAGMKYELTLEIASGLGALGQVVREVQDKGFGTDTFHVTQIFHHQK